MNSLIAYHFIKGELVFSITGVSVYGSSCGSIVCCRKKRILSVCFVNIKSVSADNKSRTVLVFIKYLKKACRVFFIGHINVIAKLGEFNAMYFIPIHFPAFRFHKLRTFSAFKIKIRYIYPTMVVLSQSYYHTLTYDKMLLLFVYSKKPVGILSVIGIDLSRCGLVKVELVRIHIKQAAAKLGVYYLLVRKAVQSLRIGIIDYIFIGAGPCRIKVAVQMRRYSVFGLLLTVDKLHQTEYQKKDSKNAYQYRTEEQSIISEQPFFLFVHFPTSEQPVVLHIIAQLRPKNDYCGITISYISSPYTLIRITSRFLCTGK